MGEGGILLSVDGLGRCYGDFVAVDDVSFSVGAGECFGLLGPNGAGKTTIVRMLMGILAPSGGRAAVAGYDCFLEGDRVKRHVGYLPDDPVFWDYLTGAELLRFAIEMHGLDPSSAEARALSMAERLALREDLGEYAVNYSKGMKKKLAIVFAFLHEPELLLLDEPTNGLDPIVTRVFYELLDEHVARGGGVFFSTHLLDQAQRVCHRLAILHRGRIAAMGPLDTLRAANGEAASLEEIFFAVTQEATRLDTKKIGASQAGESCP